jgi:hypothetical protein
MTLTANQDGLSLSASLDSTTVEPGGSVTMNITIQNDRTTAAGYLSPCTGSLVIMTGTLPLPLEPPGRTWTGIEGTFKQAAMAGTNATGAARSLSVDSGDSIRFSVDSGTCELLQSTTYPLLSPGQTINTQLIWQADLIKGLPALPGNMTFTITLMGWQGYPAILPTSPPGGYPSTNFISPDQSMLHVSGHVEISGTAPRLLSKGQIIDAALAYPQFASWLAEKPSSAWTNINVVLETFGPTGAVPAGTYLTGPCWMIDVIRGDEASPSQKRLWVDPYNGTVVLGE